MSNHGSNPEMERELHEQMKNLFGEFTNGRMNEHDQGAIAVGIAHENGRVVMRFPKNLNFIGFTADQAIDIAELLVDHARKCGSKKPLTVKIG